MAAEKKSDVSVTLLNRGQRHFDVGVDSDGKPRRHAPGSTMVYSAEEAKKMQGYRDIVDLSKLPGAVDTRQLQADNAKLLAESIALKAQLEALQPKKKEAKKEEVKEAVKA